MIPHRRREQLKASAVNSSLDINDTAESAEIQFKRTEREAEGFNTFVVVDTLIFGFTVSTWFEFDETLFNDHPALLIFFCFFLAMTIVATGFGASIMAALHVASMKILSKRSSLHIEQLYVFFICLLFIHIIFVF